MYRHLPSLSLLASLTLFLFSCGLTPPDFDKSGEKDAVCNFSSVVDVPSPYELTQVALIDADHDFFSFQMLNRQQGYALGTTHVGGFADVWKTENGGISWSNVSPQISRHPISLHFLDHEVGFVTTQNVTGCPDSCDARTSLLKTTDGGASWQEVFYPTLSGALHHLQQDEKGNLYANLFDVRVGNGVSETNITLVTSTDGGLTFDSLFTAPSYGSTHSPFSFTIAEDRIYAAGVEGQIFVLETNGTLVDQVFVRANSAITGIQVLSSERLVVGTTSGVLFSDDAGKSWKLLREGWGKILTANSLEGGQVEAVIAITNDYCPGDVARSIDVLAYTNDTGASWVDSSPALNTVHALAHKPHYFDERETWLLLQNKVFSLTK